MKDRSSHIIASTLFALACVLGAAAPAKAQEAIHDGKYIVLVFDQEVSTQYGGCLIVSNRGFDRVPSLYDWHQPDRGWCGLSDDMGDMLRNGQAIWEVQAVVASSGERAYVIRSGVNGDCLIRGNNGFAAQPSLHRWTELPHGDPRYCGFPDADALIRNGQAAWTLETGEPSPQIFTAHSASTGGPQKGFLSFANTPSVYPNTVNRDTFASFTGGANRWVFVFWRAE